MQPGKVICATCLSSFANKSSLKRHIRTTHPSIIHFNSKFISNHLVPFECTECQKKFSRRDNLKRHQQLCIFGQVQELFECEHCKQKFSKKSNLVRHLPIHYRSGKFRTTRIQCVECCSRFTSKKILNEHYKIDHHVQFQYENIRFECFRKFEEWKNNLEQETICQFRKYSTSQSETKLNIHYICHRSGIYKGTGTDRKRIMKLNGSKRIGGDCPADIMVSCNRVDYSCVITFQKVHVGHEIGTKNELQHTHLSKEEKVQLETELNTDVTTAEIERKPILPDIINGADVYNVSRKFKTNNHMFAFGNDELSLQSFIMQNSESILYFKDKWKDDEKYGLLENCDYMIVIMNTVQEKNLRRYGHKVIAVDSTHGANPRGYLLHTLLIVNVDLEGFPVAFALTNRNDHKGISVFFKCVKDKVGIIKTRILMSDVQLTYFNCWSDIMQPPERHLYCIWHVYDRWKKNLKKISNFEKKKKVKELLYSLATEVDTTLFEAGLQSFLLNFDNDTKNFIKYFCTYYAVCREKWAYCYRLDAEMNTNMYLERFHNVLKKNVAKGKKIKTITCCLKYLLEYLKIKEKDYLCKEVKPKIPSKFRTLRCRHKTAEKELATVNQIRIEHISCNTWLISSFTDTSPAQETYTVKRREQSTVECADNCNLVCIQCQICFHQYKCTCQDSSVNNNMCKHIHMLGISGLGDNAATTATMQTDVEILASLRDIGEREISVNAELKNEIEKAKHIFVEALQYATNVAQVRKVIERYIMPIKPALRAANMPDLPGTDI